MLINRSSGIKLLLCAGSLWMLSCTSVNISPDGNLNEQIKAENRVMKKTLTLAVRENSVLKDENIQYKGQNNRLKTEIKLLASEFESLKKKQMQDVALLNEKYENLSKKNKILENESSFKIQELTAMNKAIEEKMTGDIAILNQNIRKQEEKFNKERSEIETLFNAKEQEYQKLLKLLQKEIQNADIELASLKSKLAESEANLASAKTDILKKDEANKDLKKNIDSLNSLVEKKKDDSEIVKTGTP